MASTTYDQDTATHIKLPYEISIPSPLVIRKRLKLIGPRTRNLRVRNVTESDEEEKHIKSVGSGSFAQPQECHDVPHPEQGCEAKEVLDVSTQMDLHSQRPVPLPAFQISRSHNTTTPKIRPNRPQDSNVIAPWIQTASNDCLLSNPDPGTSTPIITLNSQIQEWRKCLEKTFIEREKVVTKVVNTMSELRRHHGLLKLHRKELFDVGKKVGLLESLIERSAAMCNT